MEGKESKEIPKITAKSFADWTVGPDYEIVKQVGSGSYGFVVEAIHKPTGKKVAIKRLTRMFDDLVDCKRILREVSLLRRMNHPNVVNLLDILEPSDPDNFEELYVVFEYSQSDLKKLFKSPVHLQLVHIQTLIYNILAGLNYIHSAEVLHRDIKPANILINEDCSVQICDFGLARSVSGLASVHIYDAEFYATNEADTSDDSDKPSHLRKDAKPAAAGPAGKMSKGARMNPKSMKRELTSHVVTRWYRAPELILLEKHYTAAIDVWSAGCIFAELLGMLKENAPTFMDRTPLFPGSSCFPLSPDKSAIVSKSGFPHSSTDQLMVIFKVLGTPGADDIDFVTDAKAIEYLKSWPPSKGQEFKTLFPGATADALDLLTQMTSFNPKKRISVESALEHPFLTKVRDKSRETKSSAPVLLEFEKEGALSAERLRELFMIEAKYFAELRKKR